MSVSDHGLEAMRKSAQEMTAGDKSDYYLKIKVVAAPTEIQLSSTSISSGSVADDRVGIITVVDSSATSQTLSITNDPDNKFAIESGDISYLILSDSVSSVTKGTHLVTITTVNEFGYSISQAFTITVLTPNTTSVLMNGIDEYLSGGDIHKYDIANAFSICMWIKPDNTAAARILFSKATVNASVNGYMLQSNATTGALYLQMRATTSTSHTFNTVLTAGSWQFVCFTYSGASNISGASVYKNAVKNSTSPSGALSGTMLFGQPFYIGQRNNSFGFFSGNMDEITVWNKALTQSEVTELYNAGVVYDYSEHSAASNLQSWYRFDNDTIPTITDNVGSDDLTSYNMDSSNLSGDVV